jgi:hypothetical protein
MPLSKARAKVVEGLLSNNGSADDPDIAEDIKLVEREVADELGSAHPIVQDKAALRRFVVARKLCNAEVITMIEEHMKWRAASVPVPITEALVAELKKGKIELFGQDTQGRQVVMIRSGKFDPKERDLDTAVASVVYMIEKALAAQPNSQFTVFYDRTNFLLRKNWDYEFIKAVAGVVSNNYTERLAGAYLYPASGVLNMLWNLVKFFFEPRTRSKVQLITSDTLLLTLIPAKFVPVTSGGFFIYEFDPSIYDALKTEPPHAVEIS